MGAPASQTGCSSLRDQAPAGLDHSASPPRAEEHLGRFGFHPDPAIDFCEEVADILGKHYSIALGNEPDDPEVNERICRAMTFRVGGDQGAVGAKMVLRRIEAERYPGRGFGKVKSWDCWPFGEPCEWPQWYAAQVETGRPKIEAALAKARGEQP